MATEMTKIAFDKAMKLKKQGKPIIMKKVMQESGYSKEMSKHPGVLVGSKGWLELLAQVDEKPLLERFASIALEGSERNSIEACKELLKLKDRYPDKKFKVGKLDEDLKDISDDKSTETTTEDKLDSSSEATGHPE